MAVKSQAVRRTGTVCKYDVEKGYGFIIPDGGGASLFVHHTNIIAQGFRFLKEAESVEFLTAVKEGRTRAIDVTVPGRSSYQYITRPSVGILGSERGALGSTSSISKPRKLQPCSNCGRRGHIALLCPIEESCCKCGFHGHASVLCPLVCFRCGEFGHLSPFCPRLIVDQFIAASTSLVPMPSQTYFGPPPLVRNCSSEMLALPSPSNSAANGNFKMQRGQYEEIPCSKCGEIGHLTFSCPLEQPCSRRRELGHHHLLYPHETASNSRYAAVVQRGAVTARPLDNSSKNVDFTTDVLIDGQFQSINMTRLLLAGARSFGMGLGELEQVPRLCPSKQLTACSLCGELGHVYLLCPHEVEGSSRAAAVACNLGEGIKALYLDLSRKVELDNEFTTDVQEDGQLQARDITGPRETHVRGPRCPVGRKESNSDPCSRCGKLGHLPFLCPQLCVGEQPCFRCEQLGHLSLPCLRHAADNGRIASPSPPAGGGNT